MSLAENRLGRPSRRHAHVCRTCDATFGCKAELLEHEQDEHSGMHNKASKQKLTKHTVTETSVTGTGNEFGVADLISRSNRKSGMSAPLIDHEEVCKNATHSPMKSISISELSKRQLLNAGTRSLVWQGKRSVPLTSTSESVDAMGKHSAGNSEQQLSKLLIKNRSAETVTSGQKGAQQLFSAGSSLTGKSKLCEKFDDSPNNAGGTPKVLKRFNDVREFVGLKRNKKDIAVEESIVNDKQSTKIAAEGIRILKSQLMVRKDNATNVVSELNTLQQEQARDSEATVSSSKGLLSQQSHDSSARQPMDATLEFSSEAAGDECHDGDHLVATSPGAHEAVVTDAQQTDNASHCSNSTTVAEKENSQSLIVRNEMDIQLQPLFISSSECFSEITVDTSPETVVKKRSPKPSTSEPTVGGTKKVYAVAVMPPSPAPRVILPKQPSVSRKSNAQRMVSVLLRNQDINRLGVVSDSSSKLSGTSKVGESGHDVECTTLEEVIEEVITDDPEPSSSLANTDSNTGASGSEDTFSSCSLVGKAPQNETAVDNASDMNNQDDIEPMGEIVAAEQPSLPDKKKAVKSLCQNDDQGKSEEAGVESEGEFAESIVKEEVSEEAGTKANLTADDLNAIESDQPGNCRLCGKSYENGVELMNHMVVDHICHQCGKEFRQPSNLRKHVRISHDNIRPHECPVCGRGFAFASNLSSHLAVHFPVNANEKPYECMQCDRTFRHPASLRKHMKEEHLEGPKPYACTECDKAFVYKCALDLHMRKHSMLRPFTCPRCDAGFKHTANLQKHIKLMHPGPCRECGDESAKCEHALANRAAIRAKNTCMECGRSYDSASSLAVHERIHRGVKLETCDLCGQGFQHRSNLQKHMMKHTGNKPHACTQCPRAFYARHNLIAHMRKHTGNSPYECDQCGKRFCTKNSLQVHMNLHANIRPFSCDVCGRQFSQLGNLQKHMTVHTGERPHVCSVCQRSFTDISALKRHMAAIHEHDARYVCDICNKRFLHLSSVRSHRLMHMGVKPHKCETCGKLFTHRSGYMRHLRLHERSDSLLYVNERKEVVLKPGEYIVYLTE